MTKHDLLRKGFVFSNFSTEELDRMTPLATELSVESGQYVFNEGSPATSMYVIRSGSVEIIKKGADNSTLTVARLSVGDHFGEMAFVDRGLRAAGARAISVLELFEIKYDELESLVSTNPVLGLKLYHSISKTLCERIRRTTSDLSALFLG